MNKTKNNNPYAYTVTQNLIDAGCSHEMVKQFMELQGKEEEQLNLLSCHRKKLLKQLHLEEHRIDCLDYLVYRMQKNNNYILTGGFHNENNSKSDL